MERAETGVEEEEEKPSVWHVRELVVDHASVKNVAAPRLEYSRPRVAGSFTGNINFSSRDVLAVHENERRRRTLFPERRIKFHVINRSLSFSCTYDLVHLANDLGSWLLGDLDPPKHVKFNSLGGFKISLKFEKNGQFGLAHQREDSPLRVALLGTEMFSKAKV
mgnify:CR=1 FL=1